MIRVVHKACGDTAFWYEGILAPGVVVDPAKTTLPDGTRPIAGTPMFCGSCGEPIPAPDGTVLDLEPDPATARRLD